MYIPKHYLGKENKEAIAFMKRFNFGTIITSEGDIPITTHLPFVISEEDNNVILTSPSQGQMNIGNILLLMKT